MSVVEIVLQLENVGVLDAAGQRALSDMTVSR
jgi:hypothetical protein